MKKFQAALEPKEILCIPEPSTQLAWLRLAQSRLPGPRLQPAVIRHTRKQSGPDGWSAQSEVRRWTRAPYVLVPEAQAVSDRLLLGEAGVLVRRVPSGRRLLRQDPAEVVYDEIHSYEEISKPTLEDLTRVQAACVVRTQLELFKSWSELDPQQQLQLVAFPATWAQLAPALGTLETLQLLLSEQAHERCRSSVLEAALSGGFRPGPHILAWLLAQPGWNQNPALVAMARSAAGTEPQPPVLELQSHPNPVVRARLVELLPAGHDWMGWLATESHPEVRESIRRTVERRLTPAQLLSRLEGPDLAMRGEALGWLLAGWSKKLECSQDWKALNLALRTPIGRANRQKLGQKLRASGQLSLVSRLMSRLET